MRFRTRSIVLALLGGAAIGRTAVAQAPNPDPLGRRISVHFDRVDLATALTRLRTVFGIQLAFSSEALPSGRAVSIDASDESVANVLSKLLDGTGLQVVPLTGGALVIAPGAAPIPASGTRSPLPDLATGVRELDQIVVMGTPVSGGPEKDQPTAVSVVKAADLKSFHFSRTADLFRTALPGVVLWDQGPSGPPAEIAAVRGASSFTARGLKTYIDGVEVASPTLVTLVDPRSIERIEVIRGPQGAALYGSDAINGVIQIVTRKGNLGENPKLQAKAAVAAGPFDRQQLSTMLRQDYAGSMSWGGSSASIAGSGSLGRVGSGASVPNTRTWSAQAGGQVAIGSLLISGLARGGQFDFTEDQFLQIPLSDPSPSAAASQVDVATLGLTAVQQVKDWWIQTFVAGYDRASGALGSERNYLEVMRQPLGATHETAQKSSFRYSSALTADWGSAASLTATVGLEWTQLERARGAWDNNLSTRYVDLYDDEVRNTGSFLQTKLRTGAFVLNAGARAEWSSAFGASYGTAWAPSVGASWTKPVGNLALRLRGGWGKGIRPPEPGMSRAMATSTIRQEANSSLAPESQAGLELGADLYAGASGYFKVTYFDQKATDLIQSVLIAGEQGALRTYQYQNVGAIRNNGFELEAGARAGQFGIDASFYTTNSRVQRIASSYSGSLRSGDRLPEIPESSGAARINYSFRTVQLALGTTFLGPWTGYDWAEISRVNAGQSPARPSLRDYLMRYPSVVKPYLSVSFDLNRRVTSYLNIDNLTNSGRFEQNNGVPPAGRSVLIGFELRP